MKKKHFILLFTVALILFTTSCEEEVKKSRFRLVKSVYYEHVKAPIAKRMFEYDNQGRIARMTTQARNGEKINEFSYSYEGNKISISNSDTEYICNLNDMGYVESIDRPDYPPFFTTFSYKEGYLTSAKTSSGYITDTKLEWKDGCDVLINRIADHDNYKEEINTSNYYNNIANNYNCNIDINNLIRGVWYDDSKHPIAMFDLLGKRANRLVSREVNNYDDYAVGAALFYTLDSEGFVTIVNINGADVIIEYY